MNTPLAPTTPATTATSATHPSPAPSATSGSTAAAPALRSGQSECVVIVDFGSQTAQLIARRVREAGVFSILVSPASALKTINEMPVPPKGIVLSGGPASVYEENAPVADPALLDLGIPVLGICYGMQWACREIGFRVERADHREFGRAQISLTPPAVAPAAHGTAAAPAADLLSALPQKTTVWMSHGDQVFPPTPTSASAASDAASMHTQVLASTPTCPLAAVRISRPGRAPFYGVQFHPEVTHTPQGSTIIQNFLYEICRCTGTWRMADYLESAVADIRRRVGNDRVLCGLSGGVDSSVVAALLHRAIGDQLTCVFVDTGLLRKNERAFVQTTFRDHFHIDLRVADSEALFLGDLAGVSDPQEKRRRIGHRFIDVFQSEADAVAAQTTSSSRGRFAFLAQGTLYPDVIESGHGHAGTSAGIKLHHNVGGLPAEMDFQLIEPLRDLFKDEVRKLGEVLGLPEKLVWRHPFPGPGLAVRVLGEVTRPKLDILRECDQILLDEIAAADLYRSTSQVFAVLLPVRSVGVMGDGRTYDYVVALRAVTTEDFMTADWARIPYDTLARISTRIINEVRGVNRVVYDISSKPPATIEWE